VTGTVHTAWFTEAMTQLADPVELVVALQVWAVLPEPRVKVTGSLAKGVPLVVRTPERVAG
jgi:hypothetical protein